MVKQMRKLSVIEFFPKILRIMNVLLFAFLLLNSINNPVLGTLVNAFQEDVQVNQTRENNKVLEAFGVASIWTYNTVREILTDTTLNDIDDDGHLEVIIEDEFNRVYVLDAKSGGIEWSVTTVNSLMKKVALIDLENDNKLELANSYDNGYVVLRGYDSTPLWLYDAGNSITNMVSAGDFNGDGMQDLVFSTSNGYAVTIDPTNQNFLWMFFNHRVFGS